MAVAAKGERMLGAIRRWFREESLGITIPVGVVLGLTVEMVIAWLVWGFEIGWQTNRASTGTIRRLDIAPLGIRFNYEEFLAHGVALLILAAVAYLLFLWPLASDYEDEPETRECPECKSDIFADATRCAFCTSVVTPLEVADSGAP